MEVLMTSHAHDLTCPWGWSFMLQWGQSSGELPPKRGDATLLLPLNASCVLLPALELACAHGKPIQGAHPSESSGYPTACCPPCCSNQPRVGCREQVAGAVPLEHETTARRVENLSSISKHLPIHGSTGKSRPRKKKPDLSQNWEALQTLMPTASAGTIREPTGPWRN